MKFKWTPELEAQLVSQFGEAAARSVHVTQADLHTAAEALGTSSRSVGSKLRKMGYEVQKASEVPAASAWTTEATEQLVNFLNENNGRYTYAEIGAALSVEPKKVQGKILSLEMTGYVLPTPKPVHTSEFSDSQTAQIIELAAQGASIEAISASVGVAENKVRGKCLALFRAGSIESVPHKENKVQHVDAFDGIATTEFTVAELAARIEKSERSVKSMLTRRKLAASDYDGVAKAQKAESRNQ